MTTLPPAPPAQSAPLNARPIAVKAADGYLLRGELSLPAGARAGQQFPTVLLLHGSGLNDMNETIPEQLAGTPGGSAVFLQITRRLNAAGFAVVRYNKRGVSGVGPVKLPAELRQGPAFNTITGFAADALAVLQATRTLPGVNPAQVFVLGHSEGTLIAAGLAKTHPELLRGLILMGTVGDSFRDTLYGQNVTRPLSQLHELFDADHDGLLSPAELNSTAQKLGLNLAEQAQDLGLEQRGGQWVFLPEMKPDSQGRVQIDGRIKDHLEAAFAPFPNLPDLPPHLRLYFADADAYGSVTTLLPSFSGPVLMLHGAADPQTLLSGVQKAFAAAKAGGNTQITLKVYPSYGHTLSPAGKNGLPTLGPIADGPLNDMAAWLRAVTR